MCQWLCNFVIAKLTPIMLANITYGTFLLFGACCVLMGLYAVFFVPETKNVPLESIHLLFENGIIKGCTRDIFPSRARAKDLQLHSHVSDEQVRKDVLTIKTQPVKGPEQNHLPRDEERPATKYVRGVTIQTEEA